MEETLWESVMVPAWRKKRGETGRHRTRRKKAGDNRKKTVKIESVLYVPYTSDIELRKNIQQREDSLL